MNRTTTPRPTPVCPLLMAGRASIYEYDEPRKAAGVRCIGSACAYWTRSDLSDLELRRARARGEGIPGVCSQAPHAEPWPDPATPVRSDPAEEE